MNTYTDQLGVTAGNLNLSSGSSTNNTSTTNVNAILSQPKNSMSNSSNTISPDRIAETVDKQFISLQEKLTLQTLVSDALTKQIYDIDNDELVDKAKLAENALNADHAINADIAQHSNTSEIAARATDASHADTADTATNATTAITASRALVADEVEWNDVKNVPANIARKEDINWENIKDNAPENIKNINTVVDRVATLENNSHAHANMDSLDKITTDPTTGKPLWHNLDWPLADGVMLKDYYDSDGDGIVDRARTVEYTDITHLPTKFTPEDHTHDPSEINTDSNNRFVTDAQMYRWDNMQPKLEYKAENAGLKGSPNGYAPLDINATIPANYLPEISWNTITNKPTSTVDAIDDSVTRKHSHSNISALDMLDKTSDDIPIWNNKEWPYPGNMKKSIYDADDDGVVDHTLRSDFVDWLGVMNRPTSSTENIDDAVIKRHHHNNLSALANIGVTNSGDPLWNGSEWPYDMKTSVYDTNGDGIVDKAEEANSIKWSNIKEGPESPVMGIDDAVRNMHLHTNKEIIDALNENDTKDRITYHGADLAYPSDLKILLIQQIIQKIEGGEEVEYKTIKCKQSVDIDVDDSIHLIGDNKFPGKNKYYGTDNREVKGFYSLPKQKNIQVSSSLGAEEDEDNVKIFLVNDEENISAKKYYGTDAYGTLGYHELPKTLSATGSVKISNNTITLVNDTNDKIDNTFYGVKNGVSGYYTINSDIIEESDDKKFVSSELLDKLVNLSSATISAENVIEDDNNRFVTTNMYNAVVGFMNGTPISTNPSDSGTSIVNNITNNYTVTYRARQTVVSAMDNFFVADGSDLIIRASTDDPLIISFADGNKEIIKEITANNTVVNVPTIMNVGTAYIGATLKNDNVIFFKTGIKPVYSNIEPTDKTDGKYWFNINTYTMYKSNGTKYVKTDPTVFLGSIIANNTLTMVTPYALNGFYDSGWYDVSYGTSYSHNHNIGTDDVIVTAYRGSNGINGGEFAFGLHNTTLSDAMAVGDRITKVTENSVCTTRYNKIIYNSDASAIIYGNSTQHRVIVRRSW